MSNDEKHKLQEILNEDVIFRLDFVLYNERTEKVTIIRDNEFIYVKREDYPVKRFSGISGNTSVEHKLLKEYLATLFGFTLFLESSGEYKLASLEAMFLPYYVAQDYGWVLTLKSFRGLDYFKNFKSDYYDYYLGIDNEYDREERQRLETEKKGYEIDLKLLSTKIEKTSDFRLSLLKDEEFINKAAEYLDEYRDDRNDLIEQERKYITLCNQIKLLEQRQNILKKVFRDINNQIPSVSKCPTCKQHLPSSFERLYIHSQDVDDTTTQLSKIKVEIKEQIGRRNSIEKRILELRDKISIKYSLLLDYRIDNLSVNTWIENKANVQLLSMIYQQIGETEINLHDVNEKLKKFKSDDTLKQERKSKDSVFLSCFRYNLKALQVKDLDEDRSLYKMSLFPQQGVELLKTLMAYYFAFNKVIKRTDYVHRFPFVMDAIFKEDLEDDNRKLILEFIYANKPNDTQIIFSIADSKKNKTTAEDYNRMYLNKEANLILINKDRQRAFLSEFDSKHDALRDETFELMDL
jgi:hypothetical protein